MKTLNPACFFSTGRGFRPGCAQQLLQMLSRLRCHCRHALQIDALAGALRGRRHSALLQGLIRTQRQLVAGGKRIIRPAYKYLGKPQEYVPLEKR